MKWIFTILLLTSLNAHAQLSASPSFVDFGDVSIENGFGRRTSVSIYSNSNESNTVFVNNSCFGAFYTNNNCYTLMPYGSCSIQIEYRPRRAGYDSCSININGNRGGYTSINVRGRGVESYVNEVYGPYAE